LEQTGFRGNVYHLFARKVYQAIDREYLRTRKKHEIECVKTRLVALDFVLAHRQHRYLETEAEKVSFFEKGHNVSRSHLPVKLYRARKSAEVTPRYFVDRFPLFIDSGSVALTFIYIDAGAVTLDGFVTHVRVYSPLFQALSAFHFACLPDAAPVSGCAIGVPEDSPGPTFTGEIGVCFGLLPAPQSLGQEGTGG